MRIRVKVPYTYTVWRNSRLATMVDRFCHSPACGMFFFPFAILYPIYLYLSLFDLFHSLSPSVGKLLGTFTAFATLVLFIGAFVLAFLLPRLCDKHKWSARIAFWDVKRQQGDAQSIRRFQQVKAALILFIGIFLVLPGAIWGARTVYIKAAAAAYNARMQVLNTPETVSRTDDLVVAYHVPDRQYTRTYVPDELQAEKPEQVGYILRFTPGTQLVGFYGTFSSGGSAYRRTCKVTICERSTGLEVASEVFTGKKPPYSVSKNEDGYGSSPDQEEIMAWVRDVYAGLRP